MSSFYGSGFYGGSGGGSSSGGGSTTLTGTQDSPIILSTLEEGYYIIEGYYTYTEEDNIFKTQEGGLSVCITTDETNDQKVGIWESYNNSTLYVNIIAFEANGEYDIDKIALRDSGQGGDSNIIFTNILPAIGEEDVLYVTTTSIFRYVDDDYIDLTSESAWGSF